MTLTPAISAQNVHKYFGTFHAIKGVTLQIGTGEVVAILGPSGSGKSTFLRCLNGLEEIQEGKISLWHAGEELAAGPQSRVGMVFQNFNLFPHLTVVQNIILAPVGLLGIPTEAAENRAQSLLNRVGIWDQRAKYPNELSGGQQQRAAIARALAMDPSILLFDEPTSSLDPEMIQEVLAVIQEVARSGMTILVVTHELAFARQTANRVLFFDDGRVIEDAPAEDFFLGPAEERARLFLSRVLRGHGL